MSDKEVMLIADDDEINRTILREFYDSQYEVIEACDGEEAVAALEKYRDRIVVLLLDIVMPGRNGYEVLEFMHYSDLVDRIPVIIITAMDKLENEILALEQGANDIITKPFEPLVVYQRVQNVVNSFRYRRDLEKTVEAQNESIELFSNGIPGGILGIYCDDGYPLYKINDRMLQYLGYSNVEEFSAEYNGLVENAIHPSDRPLAYRIMNKRIDNDDYYEVKYRMRCKNDNYIWILDRGKRSVSEDGRKICISVCLDVTMQTELQSKLAEEREALAVKSQELISYEKIAPGGVFRAHVGNTLEIEHGNSCFYHIIGYTESQLVNEKNGDLYQVIYPDDLKTGKANLSALVKSKDKLCTTDIRIITRDGIVKWVMISGRAITTEDGLDIYGFVLDRTPQEVNLDTLILQENCISEIFDNSGDIFALYDFLTGKYLLSAECSKAFGLDNNFNDGPDSIITQDIIHPDDMDYIREIYDQFDYSRFINNVTLRLKFSDGKYRKCNVKITVFYDSFRNPVKYVIYIKTQQ